MIPLLTAILLSITFIQFVPTTARAQTSAPISQKTRSTAATTTIAPPVTLTFRDFFEPMARELKPSAKLLGLNGKHVRITGFMAQMEEAPRGAFYLCPRPVFCDEAGGGTADLPPDAVRVIVRSAKGKEIAFTPQLLEATGILEVGNRTDENGVVSAVRLILDVSQDAPHTLAPAAKIHKQ